MILRFRFITFIFLLAIAPLGCAITNKEAVLNEGEHMLVRKLDAVLLAADDLPTMEVDGTVNHRKRGIVNQPPVADGFIQSWNGTQPEEHITVHYWLLRSIVDAQTAAEEWRSFITSQGIYQHEPNPEHVVGDGTWRIENDASIWFVKNNVLVHIVARRPLLNQLPLTRSVARKIEAKINAALNQQ